MPQIRYTDSDGNEQTLTVGVDAITFDDDDIQQVARDHSLVTTEKMTSEVQRRVSSAKANAKSSLLSDDDFWREAAETRGIELRDDGTPKGSAKNDEQLEQRFKAKYVTPLETKLSEATQSVEKYRTKALEADIISAASAAGVRDAFLKPVSPGAPPPIVTMVRDSFAYDGDSDAWALKSEDGIRYDSTGKPAGAAVLLDELKGKEGFGDYFKSESMVGSGHSGSTSSPTGRVYTQAEVEKLTSDPETYAKHRDDLQAAAKEGRIRE
jgi:hypothetical protein